MTVLEESYKYLLFLRNHKTLSVSITKAGHENSKWHSQVWSFNAANFLNKKQNKSQS